MSARLHGLITVLGDTVRLLPGAPVVTGVLGGVERDVVDPADLGDVRRHRRRFAVAGRAAGGAGRR